ncbi:MAG TPA: methyltransferase domain-containing protein [Gemmatimonadales bacterium]|nr:methyltransferase domain-containing protein [Gemmatimonadales bacterium]
MPAARRLAWDCATGNGQAARMLAPHFALVAASDASLPQLRLATRLPGVCYFAALGEANALAAQRVDLVSVAQAFHWLDHERFYAEVDRVAAPGAALALFGYGRLRTTAALEAMINRFHDETVGPYWPAERRLVEQGYRGFTIPIEEVPAPLLAIEGNLSLPELLGYLRTWSAVGRYLAVHGQDPVEALAAELASEWGKPATPRKIVWPLFIRAGRWLGSGATRTRP